MSFIEFGTCIRISILGISHRRSFAVLYNSTQLQLAPLIHFYLRFTNVHVICKLKYAQGVLT